MKINYIVKVSDTKAITFPNYCVVCGRPHNDQHGTIEINPSGNGYFSSFIFIFSIIDKISSKKLTLSIPGHHSCLKSLRKSYWVRTLLALLVMTPIYIYGREQGVNRLYMILTCLIIAVPFVLWEYLRPLPIEYDHTNGKYIFTFNNRNYAEQFASLNNAKMEVMR